MAQASPKKRYTTEEEVVAPYCQSDGLLVYQPATILRCMTLREAKQAAYLVQFQTDTGKKLTQEWFFESSLKDKALAQYEVETILGARAHSTRCSITNRSCNRENGKSCTVYFEYKVKWEGYAASNNSWEPDVGIGKYSDAVLQYWLGVQSHDAKLYNKMVPPNLRSKVTKYGKSGKEESAEDSDGDDEEEDSEDEEGDEEKKAAKAGGGGNAAAKKGDGKDEEGDEEKKATKASGGGNAAAKKGDGKDEEVDENKGTDAAAKAKTTSKTNKRAAKPTAAPAAKAKRAKPSRGASARTSPRRSQKKK